jgi:hypothetical protein
MGLHVWARFAKTQTADELATLMDGGYIDQMSFATDVGVSEWTEDSDGNITWHLIEADPATGLTDVTVCAQGAFPQTDASLVASLNNAGALLASAIEAGHVTDVLIHDLVAASGSGEHGIAQAIEPQGAAIAQAVEPAGAADVADSDETRMTELQDWAKARYLNARAAR